MTKRTGGRAAMVGSITCVLAIGACASSGGPSGAAGSGSGNTSALAFAKCLRSHGVPNFPDPGAPGGFSGVSKRSPAFRSAMQTCNKLEAGGLSTGASLTEPQRLAALAQAQCIRDHGVPSFPDPTFPSTGGELFPAIPGFAPTSPAFRHAAAACRLTTTVGQPHGG